MPARYACEMETGRSATFEKARLDLLKRVIDRCIKVHPFILCPT